MIREIDGAYVAAQVRFSRQVHKGTILILEGATDAKVFNHFIDPVKCDIEVAFGKENAIKALDLLEDEGFPGVLAVVDADFDRLLDKTYSSENLCLTDKHDLDLTIFATAALKKYILEYANEKHKSDYSYVRDIVLRASLPLAYCRFVSELHGLKLYFKDLKHHEFINIDDLSTEIDVLVSKLIARSRTHCTEAKLKAFVTGESCKIHDPYQLVNGHDVAAILGIALRKLVGNRKEVQTWASEVESGLRLAFDWEKMTDTDVFRFLRNCESENKRYRVFIR
jgi:hypothetical protein